MNPPSVPRPSVPGISTPPPVPAVRSGITAPPIPVQHARDFYSSLLEQGRASIMSGAIKNEHVNARQPLSNGILVGQYLIVSLIGMGGFGLTYLAIHQKDNSQVVLKEHMPVGIAIRDSDGFFITTPTQEAEDNFQATLDEFREEINIIMALEHPGIVRIVDAFEANGTAYYVMPHIQGAHLDIPKQAKMDKGLRSREARRVRQQLTSMLNALAYLDQNQVVHRDIKPENIIITPEGHPVLLDFGSARQIRSGREYSNVFTPAFCAPEQTAPASDPTWGGMKLGPWTDLYSLAACFYYCITRMLPPAAETRIFSYPADPYHPLAKRQDLQEVYGERFLKALDRALEINVNDRWQHATDWLSYMEDGTTPDAVWRWRNLTPYVAAGVFAALGACSLYRNFSQEKEYQRLHDSSTSFTSNLLADFYQEMTDLPGSSSTQEKFCKYLDDHMQSMENSGTDGNGAHRENSAVANLHIGKYHISHGNLLQAMKKLSLAEKSILPLVSAASADHQKLYILLDIRTQKASVLHSLGQDEESARVAADAVEIGRLLCKLVPQSPDYIGALSAALLQDASVKLDNGCIDEASAVSDEVLEMLDSNLTNFSKHQMSLQRKAEALHLKGLIALNRNEPDAAEQYFSDVQELYSGLLEKSKYRLSYLEGQVRAVFYLGYVYFCRSVLAPNDTVLREKTLEIFVDHIKGCLELERLDTERPSSLSAECNSLSIAHVLLLMNGQDNLAEAYATKLMRKAKLLKQISPDSVEHARTTVSALYALAAVHRLDDRTMPLAQKELEEGRNAIEELLARDTNDYRLLNTRVRILTESSALALQQGDAAAAETYQQQAVETVERLRKIYPTNAIYRMMLERESGKLKALQSAGKD